MALTKAKLIELIDNGDIEVGGGGVSPNLLHNWDFRNPVNQRGAGYVAGANTYGLDRWKVASWGGTYQVNAGSVSNHGSFAQRIENFQQLLGKVATISICISGVIYSSTFTMPSAVGGGEIVVINVTASSHFAITVTATSSYLDVEFNVSEIIYGIEMVKLELGTVSTLAYDAPMDYGVEMLRCQRYFRRHDTINKKPYSSYLNSIYYYFELPVEMRISPTCTSISGNVITIPFTPVSGFTFIVTASSKYNYYVTANKDSHGLDIELIYGSFVADMSADL